MIAPVKGMALARRDDVLLETFGVRDDRRFHVIGESGRLLNGKQLAPLVRMGAEWDEEANRLELRFPDGSVVAGDVELGERVSTSFYGRPVEGRFVTGPWNEAVSAFVGQPLRLVQAEALCDGLDRSGAAVSMLSAAALEAMRVAAGASEP